MASYQNKAPKEPSFLKSGSKEGRNPQKIKVHTCCTLLQRLHLFREQKGGQKKKERGKVKSDVKAVIPILDELFWREKVQPVQQKCHIIHVVLLISQSDTGRTKDCNNNKKHRQ